MVRPFLRRRAWLLVLGLATTTTPVLAEKGLGPLYGLYYESRGVSQVIKSESGEVELTFEDIVTINCRGCDVQWSAPGTIFHLRNLSRRPLCVTYDFTAVDSRTEEWGSGETYYLKPGQRAKKVGGVYDYSDGDNSVNVDISFNGLLKVAEPLGKNRCS